jgi:predicted amidohydrolase YtcJ
VHCTSDGPWVPKRLGDKRSKEGAYIWKTLIHAGAHICNGTDAPVENINPLANFYSAITRKLPDGSQFYPDQCMTREEALRSCTINGAFAAFEEHIKGSLSPGKLADIVILDQDIMKIPENEILNIKVVTTIIGGKLYNLADTTK